MVARAVRLIGDGVVERDGVDGLSTRLGYSTRQLHRLITTELGTGPLRLAMAHRVQNARALLENTDLRVTDVAWAAGFGSVRQFNDRVREVFALTPSEIRARRSDPTAGRPRAPRRAGDPTGDGPGVVAHLTYRPPLYLAGLLEFLGRRAVPGVERWDGQTFERVLDLPHGPGRASLSTAGVTVPTGSTAGAGGPGRRRGGTQPAVTCTVTLYDYRDYATAVSRIRRLLDLDADPAAVAAAFGPDPLLGPAVAAAPGRRLPGTVSPFELAVRAVVGQQVSLSSARSICGTIAARLGRPADLAPGEGGAAGRSVLFPRAEELAAADPSRLTLTARRAATVIALATAVADGTTALDPGADRDETERRLLEIPGIGPWTAAYIRMRALGDPDVFLPGDLVLNRVLAGAPGPTPPIPTTWKPWRSYAVAHLWARADDPPTGRRRSGKRHPGGPTEPTRTTERKL